MAKAKVIKNKPIEIEEVAGKLKDFEGGDIDIILPSGNIDLENPDSLLGEIGIKLELGEDSTNITMETSMRYGVEVKIDGEEEFEPESDNTVDTAKALKIQDEISENNNEIGNIEIRIKNILASIKPMQDELSRLGRVEAIRKLTLDESNTANNNRLQIIELTRQLNVKKEALTELKLKNEILAKESDEIALGLSRKMYLDKAKLDLKKDEALYLIRKHIEEVFESQKIIAEKEISLRDDLILLRSITKNIDILNADQSLVLEELGIEKPKLSISNKKELLGMLKDYKNLYDKKVR